MNLNVSTNWDIKLLNELTKFDEVKNILAKKSFCIPDSGQILSESERKYVENYVRETHARGFTFIYVVDCTCLDNKEFESDKQKTIYEFFQWLSDINVDAVSLSSSILIKLVKTYFPKLKVGVSSQTLVLTDDIAVASQYDELGCDWVDINCSANRDFGRLKIIKNELKCEPRLTLQNLCIHNCPYATAHRNHQSHIPYEKNQEDIFDYYSTICTKMYLEKPENFFKARWIRPEDLVLYEEIGYGSFNIVDYSSPSSEKLLRMVKAYTERSFEGNLFSILSKDMSSIKSDYSTLISVDNQKLDGFLEYFKNSNCYNELCDNCGYCQEQAEKTITYNNKKRWDDLLKGCEASLKIL